LEGQSWVNRSLDPMLSLDLAPQRPGTRPGTRGNKGVANDTEPGMPLGTGHQTVMHCCRPWWVPVSAAIPWLG